jgi:hypothetical protein
MAVPIVLLAFHFSILYFRERTWTYALCVVGLQLALYFAHPLAALFAVLLFVSCSLYANRTAIRGFLIDTMTVVPVSALLIGWWTLYAPRAERGILSHLQDYYGDQFLRLFASRPLDLLRLDHDFLFDGLGGTLLAMAFSLGIAVPAVWGLASRRRAQRGPAHGPTTSLASVFVVVSLLCFFLLPHGLPGQRFIYERFSVFVFLGLIMLGGSLLGSRRRRWIMILSVTVALTNAVLWLDYYRRFNHENEHFTHKVFPRDALAGHTAALVYDWGFRNQPLYIQFPNYHIVWNRGVITTAIVDYRFGVVRRKADANELPRYTAWVGRFPQTTNPVYLKSPFLVVKGRAPAPIENALAQLSLVRTTADWRLYRGMIATADE